MVESLEDAMARLERDSLTTLWDRFEQDTRQRTAEAIEEQLERELEADRTQWMQDLGLLVGVGGGHTPRLWGGGAAAIMVERNTPNARTRTDKIVPMRPTTAANTNIITTNTTNYPESPWHQRLAAAQQTNGGVIFNAVAAVDPNVALTHWQVVRDTWNQATVRPQQHHQLPSVEAIRSGIDQIRQVVHSTSNNVNTNATLRTTSMQGYSTALSFVEKLVQTTSSSIRRPSSSSDSSSSSISPVNQAIAALSHFCHLFQNTVSALVHQAAAARTGPDTLSSSNTSNNATARLCESYAKLVVGRTAVDLYSVLYYCLRCGDAVAADDVLRNHHHDTTNNNTTTTNSAVSVPPSVRRMVHRLAQAQGAHASCLWDTVNTADALGAAVLKGVDPADRKDLQELLESTMRLEDNGVANNGSISSKLHQMGVYSLLAATAEDPPVTSDTVTGFKTIEDYLTQALWKAVQQPNPVDELIRLSDGLLEFGQAHFDDPSSGGWSFALPLLAIQQYERALSFLAETGGPMGLLQATHLGLILSTAEIPVRNLGENNAGTADGIVASLLVAYASELLAGFGPLAALDYLVYLPNDIRKRKEIANLIATMQDIDALAGRLDANGMSPGGALAQHFQAGERSRILAEASTLLSSDRNHQQRMAVAVMCLVLAERYDDALGLMNELLSPAQSIDRDRAFWMEQVTLFLQQYLDKRTHVGEVLERENKLSLVRTTRLLLDLNVFFDHVRNGRHDRSFADADRLHLLPTTDADRKRLEIDYRDMDPLIQKVYPFLLEATMQNLRSEHSRWKVELHRGYSDVVRLDLKKIQETARLYLSFAGAIGIGYDHMAVLSQMESLMI